MLKHAYSKSYRADILKHAVFHLDHIDYKFLLREFQVLFEVVGMPAISIILLALYMVRNAINRSGGEVTQIIGTLPEIVGAVPQVRFSDVFRLTRVISK